MYIHLIGIKGYSSSENRDAELIYHIFSLAKNGDLTYSKFQESESKGKSPAESNLYEGTPQQLNKKSFASSIETIL